MTDARLAVAITAHDSMRTIRATLESVTPIASRIVVVDSGSTDGTKELCRELGAEVVEQEWLGHVEQKQLAIDRCGDVPWVLLLDSDESLEPELRDSITSTVERDDDTCDGWSLNRKVWFLDGWLHYTFQPEWRLRLIRPGRGRVTGVNPHDRLEVDGETRRLTGVLRHDSWADLQDLAQRQIRYARIAAEEGTRGGTIFNLLASPPAAMIKQLILKRGFLDGRRGLIAACMTMNHTALKHAFMAEKREEEKK
jgi:glycosyltransferase involved in cell wall biosynthesis